MNKDQVEFDKQTAQFRQALGIDRNVLDEAIERHAELYLRVQEAYVQAGSVRDAAKTATEETYAQCSMDTRQRLAKEKDKWTESQVKDEVAVAEEWLEAIGFYQEADRRHRLLGAMVAAYEQRGKMLRELAQLYISGYYTSHTVGRAGADAKTVDATRGRTAMASTRRPVVGLPR